MWLHFYAGIRINVSKRAPALFLSVDSIYNYARRISVSFILGKGPCFCGAIILPTGTSFWYDD